MKKTIIIVILITGCFFTCRSIKDKQQKAIEIEREKQEVEELFKEYKYRFSILLNSEYFRSTLKEKHRWVIELDTLIQKSKKRLYKIKKVSFTELKELALLYGSANGQETSKIKALKNKINKTLAPNAIETKQLNQILDTTTFSLNLASNNVELEIDKLIKRYQIVRSLYSKHYSLRDTLRPFFWDLCSKYFSLLNRKDQLLKPKKDSILKILSSGGKNQNDKFIEAVIKQQKDTLLITIKRAIAPIFNLKKDSVGIYSSYNPADKRLLQKTMYFKDVSRKAIVLGQTSKTWLYKEAINSLKTKQLFLYSIDKKYTSKVLSFGKYADECTEYYYYNCKISEVMKAEKAYLFSSKYNLKLEYLNNKKIDSLINLKYRDICYDCPSDWHQQKTFARLKGYKNIYFTYVLNSTKKEEDINTPMRGLYYVNNDVIIKLWGEEIDLFGCSCL